MSSESGYERVLRFIETGSNEIEHLSAAIDLGDTLEIRNCSKCIKCMAVELGFSDVVSCLENLEDGALRCNMTCTVTSFDELQDCLSCIRKRVANGSDIEAHLPS